MIQITMTELMVLSSASFLCEPLSNDFRTLSEEKLNDFILDNVYEPHEDRTAIDILSDIEDSAVCFRDFLNAKGIDVTD